MQPKTPQTVTNLPRDCAPNVVVTGSSGALGSAIAQRLQGAGYSVHGMDLAPPPSSCAMRHHQVDLSDDASLAAAVAAVRAAAPRLGGLVHCAGVYPLVPWADYTLALWDRVHAVNVRGAFAVVTGLADCLDGGASVVLVASGAAHLGSRDVGYAASKAGLVGLMGSVGLEIPIAAGMGEISVLMGSRLYPSIALADTINRGLTVVLIVGVASLYPAWQAARKQPAEALHHV